MTRPSFWRSILPWRRRPDDFIVIDGADLLGMANNSVESFREKLAAFQSSRSTRPGRPSTFRPIRPQSNDNGGE